MPRTRPFGFDKATNRPRPKAALIAGGMFACAKRVATATKLFVMLSSSKISLKVSAVRPEGPGAAPLRARRTLARRVAAGRLVGLAGWNWRTCSGIGWCGWAGRRAGSRSSCKDSVWGAKGPAVSACRAADSSPWWTSWRARRACCWAVGACSVGVLLLVVLSCAARRGQPFPSLEGCDPGVPFRFGKCAHAGRTEEQHAWKEEPKFPRSNALLLCFRLLYGC